MARNVKPVPKSAEARRLIVKHLKNTAAKYGLSPTQLTTLTLHVAGSTVGEVSDAGATRVLNLMVSKGAYETQVYMRQLERGHKDAISPR